MSKDRRHIGPVPLPRLGTVLGAAALFIALQGTAWALPGVNTVDTGDIINGQVKRADIANNAIRHFHIKTDAVRADEIQSGAVGQDEVAADAVGASELKSTFIVGSGSFITNGTSGTATATCPAGAQVVSGGFSWDLDVDGLSTTAVELNTNANSATVRGFNASGFNRTLSARVYCIVA